MLRMLPWVGSVILLATACGGESAPDPSAPTVEILRDIIKSAGFRDIRVVTRTALPLDRLPTIAAATADSQQAQNQILDDLRERNRVARSVDARVINDAGAKATGRASARFSGPEGPVIVQVSAIGVSRDSSSAAVYWEYKCGVRCGGGTLSFYKRTLDGKWSAQRSWTRWMS